MPDSVSGYLQELDLPPIIQLFTVTFEGTPYYFTNSVRQDEIWWSGHKFNPLPIAIGNVGYTEDNQSEKPRLSISNVGLAYTAAFGALPELKGATLEYVRTFLPYIKPTSASNTTVFISKNFMTFARRLEKIPDRHIIYELDPVTVFTGKKFPPRQVLREGRLNFRFEGAGLYRG